MPALADQPRTPVACFALDATPLLVRVVNVECPMPLCQLCERLDWATAQQFRPLKGSALGAPARTGNAGGIPANTETPLRAGGPRTVLAPKPSRCKAPGPQARGPTLPVGPPLRSQQSGRTVMRSIALPQAAPSQGSQSWRVGHTARGSSRLQNMYCI